MLSTAPAADIGLPCNRRRFLSTTAVAASTGVMTATIPASAALLTGTEKGPIEIAYFEYVRLSKIADVAAAATWDIEERYEEPERPRWHPFRDEGGYKLVVTDEENRKGRCYLDDSDDNIASLQAIIAASDGEDDEFARRRRADQARTTLATIEDWKSECRRREDETGLTAARNVEEPLLEAVKKQSASILAMQAVNYREAAFQAALLRLEWDDRAVGRLMERLSELAGIPSYHDEEGAMA